MVIPTGDSTAKRPNSSERRATAADWLRRARRTYGGEEWDELRLLEKSGSTLAQLLILHKVLEERHGTILLPPDTLKDLRASILLLRPVKKPDRRTTDLLHGR